MFAVHQRHVTVMVEIPNKLGWALRDCKTADDIYVRLHRERCLLKDGQVDRAAAVTLIEQAEAAWRREMADRGFCGGSREWFVIVALMNGGYLNRRAGKLFAKKLIPAQHPWWQFWR
jgi:hypothetical protein